MDVKPNKNASNHIWIEPTPFIPEEIEIDPTQIVPGSNGRVNHTVKHLNNSNLRFHDIEGCSSKIYEVETYSSKMLEIDMYVLKESDDDEANYCPTDPSYLIGCEIKITDPKHSCINPGPDGSIDKYLNISYWEDLTNVNDPSRPPDIYNGNLMFPHLARINPAPDASSPGHFYCNKKPIASNDAKSPSVANSDRATIEGYMNQIYNKIGVTVNINLLPVKLVNFDSRDDDNQLDTDELLDYNAFAWGRGERAPIQQLYLINEYLPATVNGIGLYDSWTSAINFNSATMHTYPHEIGHARYNLHHPDGTPNSEGDPDNGWDKDGLDAPNPADNNNFMRSGPSGLASLNFYKFIVRQYQWKKIHGNH